MWKLFYTIELIIVLIAAISCSINNFISGCDLVRTVGEYNIGSGIAKIILSIALVILSIVFYQFYKLLAKW